MAPSLLDSFSNKFNFTEDMTTPDKKYDPGKFRYLMSFHERQSVPNGSGGHTSQDVPVFATRGMRVQMRDGDQLAIQAGATLDNKAQYYLIRAARNFIPAKDKNVYINGTKYIIRAVIEVDAEDRKKYYKLLCAWQD